MQRDFISYDDEEFSEPIPVTKEGKVVQGQLAWLLGQAHAVVGKTGDLFPVLTNASLISKVRKKKQGAVQVCLMYSFSCTVYCLVNDFVHCQWQWGFVFVCKFL